MKIPRPSKKLVKVLFLGTLVLLIFMMSAQTVYAQIQITSPRLGDTLPQRSTHNITWTATNIHSDVKIKLLLNQGATRIGTISENIPIIRGSFPWTVGTYIGGTAPPGSYYLVQIQRMDRTFVEAWTGFFTISESTLPGKIREGAFINLNNLCQKVDCSILHEPKITRILTPIITPGGEILIVGRNFGGSPGTVKFMGDDSAPYRLGSGNFQIVEWEDSRILAKLDETITGVQDQAIKILVKTSDGRTDALPAHFQAHRDFLKIYPERVRTNCTSNLPCQKDNAPPHNCCFDLCNAPPYPSESATFYGAHWSNCGSTVLSGEDTYTAGPFQNHWLLYDYILMRVDSFNWDGIPGNLYCPGARVEGPIGFIRGARSMNISFRWTVPNRCTITYFCNVIIVGPRGIGPGQY